MCVESYLEVRLLALPTNIRLGWEGLPGTNTLAYYERFVNYGRKSFIALVPDVKEPSSSVVTFIVHLNVGAIKRFRRFRRWAGNKLDRLSITIF